MSTLFALLDTQSDNAVVDTAPQQSQMPPRLIWVDISTAAPQPQVGWKGAQANGAWSWTPPPGPTLAQAQSIQSNLVRLACQAAITAGITSSATGTALTYPSDTTSQTNIMLTAESGGLLWCAAGSAWSMVQHTAAQAQQVRTDLLTHIQAQQQTYATRLTSIAAATTVAAVQAVTW